MIKQIFFLVLLLSMSTIIAENPLSLEVQKGESNFTIEEYFTPIYVSQLVESNPEIQAVSLQEYGQTFGYLNTLGGIGTNFLIEQGKTYEINTAEKLVIEIKN